jgi:hypothetical protein
MQNTAKQDLKAPGLSWTYQESQTWNLWLLLATQVVDPRYHLEKLQPIQVSLPHLLSWKKLHSPTQLKGINCTPSRQSSWPNKWSKISWPAWWGRENTVWGK